MGILNKLFTGSKGKVAGHAKQTRKLLETGKLEEAQAAVDELLSAITEETSQEDKAEILSIEKSLFSALLRDREPAKALDYAESILARGNDHLVAIAQGLGERGLTDKRSLKIIKDAVKARPQEKKLLLDTAKDLMKGKKEGFSEGELDFLIDTAKQYPLWKDGQGLLADLFLKEGRKDNEALNVYRNAYPNRKADRKLREVLLQSLVLNREKDEFAAAVYEDAVTTSKHPQALELLAEYYIDKKNLSSGSMPYIKRALELTDFSQDTLKQLSELVLETDGEFLDKVEILQAVYSQGYIDRNLLSFLGDSLSQANKFDDQSIEIMTLAFEQRVVSKRAILILAEHCLANDRSDEFAIRVYETYLSTWPDRPQRSIYGILGHFYANQTRVDDQAQKIYQEALVDTPTDPVIMTMLARAYHAVDRRDDSADEVYRHAFPIVDKDIKKQLATILAEMRISENEYGEETLQYLTVMGRPSSGVLAEKFDEALTNCFLATGRRGEQAQTAYFSLFEKTEATNELNPRLVELLAEIILENGVKIQRGSVEHRVYIKLFEFKKFATDEKIAFDLLSIELEQVSNKLNLTHLSVRCFEADSDKFVEAIAPAGQNDLLREVGDFYIEHYNFPLAAKAYQASFKMSPSSAVRYQLAKIHLMDGHGETSLELLQGLTDGEYQVKRRYWEAVAYQLLENAAESSRRFQELESESEIPAYLIELRKAINLEQAGKLEECLAKYKELSGNKDYPQFVRWIHLESGIVLMKLGKYEEARTHLEEIHRANPNSRAEQLFYSLAMFLLAFSKLEGGDRDAALPLLTRSVEVNRNDRLLRQVIVEILSVYGEKEFFGGSLEQAAKILEVAHRILPKRIETKVYLAYTYHRLQDFARAIIFYRDITWSDDNPRLERSQAYAYIANNQPEKAWRVFLDLARRDNLTLENFPRMVGCFLRDRDSAGGKFWEPVKFPQGVQPQYLVALLLHDGQFERAIDLLNDLTKQDPGNINYLWYLGRAYSQLGKRELAVVNWKELLKKCSESHSSDQLKIRQFTEIGLAFLGAGYAEEAMQTWDALHKLDNKNPDLPVLYAETLNLNAYQLARKSQDKLAADEWGKALKFDRENPQVVQNYAISLLQTGKHTEATQVFRLLGSLWLRMVKENPRQYSYLTKSVSHLEHAMNTLALTKGRPDHDVTRARAEEVIETYCRANQFYWILSLDKRATAAQIESEYFRLIKIFNPERHADDFMLVEESYTNLFKSAERRFLIDTFVYNPVEVEKVKPRLTRISKGGDISFEKLDAPTTLPPPDYQQLSVTTSTPEELAQPLRKLLAINYKIPDWTLL